MTKVLVVLLLLFFLFRSVEEWFFSWDGFRCHSYLFIAAQFFILRVTSWLFSFPIH